MQTWLHAFINWCLAILTPENDAGRCLCLESSSIRRFPAPSSVPCRLAGSVSQCPSAARPSPSVTVPVQAADRQVECHDKYSNIPREGTHSGEINPLNAELNPICHLLALLGGATIVVVSRLRVKYRICSRNLRPRVFCAP